jgi:molybdenum cofactor sulfurtransferase
LSQKRYPKMALIRPEIELERGVLRVRLTGSLRDSASTNEVTVPLSADPRFFSPDHTYRRANAKVCGDVVQAKTYTSAALSTFFTRALGVACHLARFPAVGSGSGSLASTRHSKPHLRKNQQKRGGMHVPGAFPETTAFIPGVSVSKPILLSNESPILTISRSSLNRLNEQIKAEGGKAAQSEVFRANIVVAGNPSYPPGAEQPYAEDDWRYLRIGQQYFELLGPCRRCQMVCVDQQTSQRDQEPFVTLSKTRRFDGRVYFGEHTCHLPVGDRASPLVQFPTIMVGDSVRPYLEGDESCDEILRALAV